MTARESRETELLVVGAGPGGYAAAFHAADRGIDVTLVDEEPKIGGVCLLRGCIPSKALLHLTELIHVTQEAASMGIGFGKPPVDLDAIREWKDGTVNQLVQGLEALCHKRSVKLVRARARFRSSGTVELAGEETGNLHFRHAILATGSHPVALPGVEITGRIMDSARALDLEEIPETLLVVGGGYVGLELGMVYAAFGSRVTLVEMTDRLMVNADGDLVEPLAERVKELFADVHLETELTSLQEENRSVHVTLENGDGASEASFDRVLVAVGRQPSSQDIGLENTGVERDDAGFVRIDKQCRTSDQQIFAIGDVAGGMLLAHEAMREGKVAAEVIAGEPAEFDARAVPAVVYTDPQVAWCGVTEQAAASEGREVEVLRFPWTASGRARSMGAGRGFTKLILEPETQRVLGVGIVGRHAETMIAEGVLAVEMGALARDLAESIHPHPTLSETLSEAAEMALGGATHWMGK